MHTPRSKPRLVRIAATLLAGPLLAGSALAQSVPLATLVVPTPAAPNETTSLSRAQTLDRLQSPVRLRFEGQPLHDVIRYLSLVAGVELQPLWAEEPGDQPASLGLDAMTPIDLDAHDLSVLAALEAALEIASDARELALPATWQFTSHGVIEVGPRERLTRPAAMRTEVYDVSDLLADPPSYGSDRSLCLVASADATDSFRWGGQSSCWGPWEPETDEQLLEFILSTVEVEQWTQNGGSSRITLLDSALVVRAPDYVHRALVGPLGQVDQTNYE